MPGKGDAEMKIDRRAFATGIIGLAFAPAAEAQARDKALDAAIASSGRSPASVARDAYRHPYASLVFWGLKPGQTIVELDAGEAGYWREILQPYAAATHGRYVGAAPYFAEGPQGSRRDLSSPLTEPGSADLVLSARNIHNYMWQPGLLQKVLADAHAALKPGGVLAVEEHRADPKAQVDAPGRPAGNGYVSVANVVSAVQGAGFTLEARSEINANPKDIKDYPFGVWTLPPVRQSSSRRVAPLSAADRARFDAIGESDRMTLRFRKV
jgi:predicted methyltransferase